MRFIKVLAQDWCISVRRRRRHFLDFGLSKYIKIIRFLKLFGK
jgi:hypothetical protein